MPTPHEIAAMEIFRQVVNGPETSGVPEIEAILRRHFPERLTRAEVLARMGNEAEEDDDEDEEPHPSARGRVIAPL